MSFIIAGRDTTATCLTWCFDELGLNPDIEARVAKEIKDVTQGADPTYDDVNENLPYLHVCGAGGGEPSLFYETTYQAVVKETLRLYPSVPKVAVSLVHAHQSDLLCVGRQASYQG